jgi:curved DNA-binding protein
MSKSNNYYKILGIRTDATPEEIKAAYRKLARKYHPDLNPNDKDANKKFQELNEASEVLSDPEKRKKYDQLGPDQQNPPHAKKPKNPKAKNSSKTGPETYKTYYDLDYGNIKVKIRVTDSYAFTGVIIEL